MKTLKLSALLLASGMTAMLSAKHHGKQHKLLVTERPILEVVTEASTLDLQALKDLASLVAAFDKAQAAMLTAIEAKDQEAINKADLELDQVRKALKGDLRLMKKANKIRDLALSKDID